MSATFLSLLLSHSMSAFNLVYTIVYAEQYIDVMLQKDINQHNH